MPIKKGKELYGNFLFPKFFSQSWKNDFVDEELIYLDFSSEILFGKEIDNQPFVQKLFSVDDSFDKFLIEKQWEKICFSAKKIFELRIKNKKKISIRKNEINFLQYFFFLTSMINGDIRFYFEENVKGYRSFDVFDSFSNSIFIRHKILRTIQFAIFELCDILLHEKINTPEIEEYIEKSTINFSEFNIYKKIYIRYNEIQEHDFTFLIAHFKIFLNENYIKFYEIPKNNIQNFYLTNKSIVNFIDDKNKKNLFSIFVIDPNYAIGFIYLGKGKGKNRDFLKYFKEDIDNQILMPAALVPEHNIADDGEFYWDSVDKYIFSSYLLSIHQIEVVNEGLSTRLLKYGLFHFYE